MSRHQNKLVNLQTAYWNANGSVITHKGEIIEFLKEYNIDVFFINESWLKPSKKFQLPNYITYRDDRLTNKGGGTAILVKINIDHRLAHSFSSSNIESTAVVVNTFSGPLKLISVYVPPNRQLIPSELDSLLEENVPTIIAGDMNAKHGSWHSLQSNHKGNVLAKYASTNSIVVDAPDTPTIHHSHSNRIPDVIDIVILKETKHLHSLKVLNELTSDHDPVLLTLTGGSNPLVPHVPINKKK